VISPPQRTLLSIPNCAGYGLQKLLAHENTLSKLAAIKQDAMNSGHKMMVVERQKRATLAPFYVMAKALLPSLDVSHLNIAYYTSLANFYTVIRVTRQPPSRIRNLTNITNTPADTSLDYGVGQNEDYVGAAEHVGQ